jgi:formamidopyrimidine-DNA glycosylase
LPELPEVETIRRQLCDAGVEGLQIESVSIGWRRVVEPLSPAQFAQRVRGRVIRHLDRYGKWLVFELDGAENLLVHLRMTGGFYMTRGRVKKGPHDRAVIQLSTGLNLHFRDPRKFGRWRLGELPNELGPDALSVTRKEFFQRLEGRNKVLKALLLDQSFIAGVGNIYADEALFEAQIDPRRRSNSLSIDEKARLYKAVRKVIRAGVRNKGTSLGKGQGNYVDLNGESGGYREKVKVYGRAGLPCVVCGQLLSKTQIAQRTTIFCSNCQT